MCFLISSKPLILHWQNETWQKIRTVKLLPRVTVRILSAVTAVATAVTETPYIYKFGFWIAIAKNSVGLILQTARTSTQEPKQDILSVRRVSQAHLSRAEIAYLSACSTAQN